MEEGIDIPNYADNETSLIKGEAFNAPVDKVIYLYNFLILYIFNICII